VKQTTFVIDSSNIAQVIKVKISPQASAGKTLKAIGQVSKKYNPATQFDYMFTNEQFAAQLAY
jgi:hypothetical protein